MVLPSHLLSFAAALVFASITILRAENLVQNPGFETGEEGWVLGIPPEHEGSAATWAIDSADPHSGASVAVMKTDEPIRWSIATKKAWPVNPGEKYRVMAWVKLGEDAKMTNHDARAYIRLTLLDSSSKLAISDPQGHLHIGLSGDVARNQSVFKLRVPELSVGWQKIEGVVEIPPETVFAGLNLFVHGVTGTIHWDDASLELVSDTTPLSKVVD